jgi:hypothetical protein
MAVALCREKSTLFQVSAAPSTARSPVPRGNRIRGFAVAISDATEIAQIRTTQGVVADRKCDAADPALSHNRRTGPG